MSRKRQLFARLAVFGGFFTLLCAGCGGGTGDLSGTVSYKGTSLKGGYVTFVPAEGPSFTSVISDDGHYSIPNMKSGSYKVTVDTEMLKASALAAAPAGMPTQRSGGGPKAPPPPAMPDDKQIKSHIDPNVGQASGYKPGPSPAEMKKSLMEKYVQIPAEYSKPETTKLTYTFEGGTKVYDIPLQ